MTTQTMPMPIDVTNPTSLRNPQGSHGAVPLPQLPPGIAAKPNTPQRLRNDLMTLAKFIHIYCQAKHDDFQPVSIKGFDIKDLVGHDVHLCPDCTKLLTHAFVKRSHCKYDLKPQCKHCPTHCYQKDYRVKIREVMRFSGPRLLLKGHISYLWHLLF